MAAIAAMLERGVRKLNYINPLHAGKVQRLLKQVVAGM